MAYMQTLVYQFSLVVVIVPHSLSFAHAGRILHAPILIVSTANVPNLSKLRITSSYILVPQLSKLMHTELFIYLENLKFYSSRKLNRMPNLVELAAVVSKNSDIINKYLTTNNLPQPSFDFDGPARFPVPLEAIEIRDARQALVNAAKAIQDLALGPNDYLQSLTTMV
jgi:hypothetical protein